LPDLDRFAALVDFKPRITRLNELPRGAIFDDRTAHWRRLSERERGGDECGGPESSDRDERSRACPCHNSTVKREGGKRKVGYSATFTVKRSDSTVNLASYHETAFIKNTEIFVKEARLSK
jgi:hypothetical protein